MRRHEFLFVCSGVLLGICLLISSAGALSVPPDQPGPYHIGLYKVWYLVPPYGVYRATIRYPATSDGQRTPVNTSAKPCPSIVVANGYEGSEWQITWIPEHLTSYGYVTLCFTPPFRGSWDTTQWASGLLGGLTTVQNQDNRRCSPIYHILDRETCGAIGLSMGGGGCIEATGKEGSLIDAAVGLAPANSARVASAARNITVPIQLQVGTHDGWIPPEDVLRKYVEYLSNETVKEYLSITGGNHIGYIDEFYANFAQRLKMDNPPGISVEQQHNISRKYFTAWFQYHLRHLNEYYTYIFGEDAQRDLETGILSEFCYNIP